MSKKIIDKGRESRDKKIDKAINQFLNNGYSTSKVKSQRKSETTRKNTIKK